MSEMPDFRDDFESDEAFDYVEERLTPSACIPFFYKGVNLMMTPDNAAVRLFLEDGPDALLAADSLDVIDELALDVPSRILLRLDDGTEVPLKEDDIIRSMVKGGFPIHVPPRPDETDQESAKLYMRMWNDDIYEAFGLDS